MTRYESVVDAVGGTPLIRLTRSAAHLRPRIYVKPEWQNPGGSVKDRAALSMVRAAEADGSLRPGGTVVEVTSGNTGIGLALIAAHLGYRSVIFTSSSIAQEKRSQLRAYGAEVRLVDAFVPKDHPDSLRSTAERFVAQEPGAWLAAQYDNPANPAAHWQTTGPEVWADTEGAVTHLVSTVGTGGTISGTGGYLKQVSEGRVVVVGADPLTSTYGGGDGSQKYIEGAGHFVHPQAQTDQWPTAFDTSVVDRYVRIDDRRAIDAVRELARTEGILAGGSAGVALAAAFEVAEELGEHDVVVVLLPDSGRTYLSTYFNDEWLAATGFAAADASSTVGEHATTATFIDASESRAAVLTRLGDGARGRDLVVVHHRERRDLPAPASDVVGVTTLERIAELAGDTPIATAATPVEFRLGTGQARDDALRRLQDAPKTALALVLDAGRVTGLVRKADLESPPSRQR